jgi:hypothetical protein
MVDTPAGTRLERQAQLWAMTRTTAGWARLRALYGEVCRAHPEYSGGIGLTEEMLIFVILEHEFPRGGLRD